MGPVSRGITKEFCLKAQGSLLEFRITVWFFEGNSGLHSSFVLNHVQSHTQ